MNLHAGLYIMLVATFTKSISGLLDCKRSKLGTEYLGHEAITKSRRTCQEWSAISHKFQQTNFPDVSIEAAGNKCRNPDNEPNGPWCYIMDANMEFSWEYCDIPMCLELATEGAQNTSESGSRARDISPESPAGLTTIHYMVINGTQIAEETSTISSTFMTTTGNCGATEEVTSGFTTITDVVATIPSTRTQMTTTTEAAATVEDAPSMTVDDVWNTIGMYFDIIEEMKLGDQLLVISQILIL